MANDISISVKMDNKSAAGFTDVNAGLATLKTSSGEAATSLRTLTTRSGTASLSLKTVKTNAENASQALDDLRLHAGDITIKATVQDDTRTGADAVKVAVDDLKRLGPVSIAVNFSGAAGDITTTSDALKSLKDNARDAGTAVGTLGTKSAAAALKLEALKVAANGAGDELERLRDRAATASLAIAELRTRTSAASSAMTRLGERSRTADMRMDDLSNRSRTLHQDLSTLNGTAQATGNSLQGLRGNLGNVSSSSGRTSGAVDDLRGALISLAPAIVPVAASLVPVVTGAAAAGLGLAAFGAAVIPQVKQLSDLSGALDTLQMAQAAGAVSDTKAVAAQQKALAALDGVPVATKRAAAGFGQLKTDFTDWSNSLAGFTMDPVTKSFAVAEAVLPKLSPLVKDTSTQLSRLMNVAGGAVETRGFDDLTAKLDHYTNGILRDAVNETVHFTRVLSEGSADGPVSEFMAYAKSEGPEVKRVLEDLATTVGHVLQASADAGPGLLTVVDSLAKLINAVPPELLGRLMQLYTTMKLVKVASAGLGSVGSSIGTFTTSLTAMRTASVAAGGGLAGVRAGIGTLSTGAKIGGTIAVIAGLTLALKHFVDSAGAAKVSASGFESQIKGLASGDDAHKTLDQIATDLANINKNPGGGLVKDNSVLGLVFGGSKKSSADKDLKNFGSALADLVNSGNAPEAAAALQKLNAAGEKIPTKYLKDYKSALADAKFEADLTAQSMGLFGKQAQATQATLDAQKQSADGLRQSIQALNDVNRAGISAEIDVEQSMSDATKAAKAGGKALTERNGQLVLSTQKSRDEATALNDLAAKTDAATAAARDQGKSWATVQGIYATGRAALIKTAEQMGLNTSQAKKLADQILKTPSKTAFLKGDLSDLQAKLAKAKADLKSAPSSKTASLKATITDLQKKIAAAKAAIAGVHGKTVTISTNYVKNGGSQAKAGNPYFAAGGHIVGPGSGTSDSVPIWASAGEFVVNADAAAKNRKLLEAINGGQMKGFKSGGSVSSSEKSARSSAMGDLTQSYFGKAAGYKNNEFQTATGAPGSVNDLAGTLNAWQAKIKAATHGSEESKLVKSFDAFGKAALKNEAALTKVNGQLTSAKDKLASLKDSFNQLKTSVSDSVVSFGSIVAQTGQPGGSSSVISQLSGNVGEAKSFASELEALRKKGLNAQSLSEIAQAGISGGGLETAQRLMGSSPADIKTINNLEKQLQAAGGAAGTSAATGMYGAQINSAQALVTGLQKQQSKLDAVMIKAADAMAARLKKVMSAKASGGVIGAAASGGVRSGMTLVGERGPELANLAAGSRVRTAGDTARLLGASGGSAGQPIQINLMLDGTVLARQLLPSQRELVRQLGGTVQDVYGKR